MQSVRNLARRPLVGNACGRRGSWGVATDRRRTRRSTNPRPTRFRSIHKLAASAAFKTLFREGMSLVEETAAYLDGPGRDESRRLARPAGARLRDRKHAPDDAADAGRLLAAAAARRQRGRADPRSGAVGEASRAARRAGRRLPGRAVRAIARGVARVQPQIAAAAGARRPSRPLARRSRSLRRRRRAARSPSSSSACGPPSPAERAPTGPRPLGGAGACAAALLAALLGK